jgi:hypothetical protein
LDLDDCADCDLVVMVGVGVGIDDDLGFDSVVVELNVDEDEHGNDEVDDHPVLLLLQISYPLYYFHSPLDSLMMMIVLVLVVGFGFGFGFGCFHWLQEPRRLPRLPPLKLDLEGKLLLGEWPQRRVHHLYAHPHYHSH